LTKNLIILALALVSFNTWSDSSKFRPYVIKKGDIVSQLLVDNKLTPLYGSQKWVEKVLKLNRLSYKSARKLEPGDVVVLPIESFVFNKDEFNDQLQLVASATERKTVKRLEKEYLRDKTHNITTSADTFFQNYNFNNGNNVAVNQNFRFSVEYKRKNTKASNISFNPIVTATVITQSQADFDSNEDLSADFTPSYQLDLGVEINSKEIALAFTPSVRAEEFSRLNLNNDEYQVKRDSLQWTKFDLRKDFINKKNTYFIGADYAIANQLDGEITAAYLGVSFMKHYNFIYRQERASFSLGEEVDQDIQSIRLGYRW